MAKPRMHTRKLFSAELVGCILILKRGAHVTRSDRNGDVQSMSYDGSAIMWLTIGDRLVVIGSQTGAGVVEIAHVAQDGLTCRVRVLRGPLSDGTTHVMKFAPRKRAAAMKLPPMENVG
jgi:hypothetical protein